MSFQSNLFYIINIFRGGTTFSKYETIVVCLKVDGYHTPTLWGIFILVLLDKTP